MRRSMSKRMMKGGNGGRSSSSRSSRSSSGYSRTRSMGRSCRTVVLLLLLLRLLLPLEDLVGGFQTYGNLSTCNPRLYTFNYATPSE